MPNIFQKVPHMPHTYLQVKVKDVYIHTVHVLYNLLPIKSFKWYFGNMLLKCEEWKSNTSFNS